MENLVIELKNLNVEQIKQTGDADKLKAWNCNTENHRNQRSLIVTNCYSNMSNETISEPTAPLLPLNNDETECKEIQDCSSSYSEESLEEENSVNDESEETAAADVIDASQNEKMRCIGGRGGINVRRLPQRSVKQDILHSKNLRTSMKQPKISPKSTQKLRPAEIKKLYTNKKITNFRPTNLETIFEEPQPMRGGGQQQQLRLVGSKKLRRTLVCTDGLNTNKTVVNRRRARIKKNLGRRATWKKIPLQHFLSYMQTNLSSENEAKDFNGTLDGSDDLKAIEETVPITPKTANDSEDLEMHMVDEDKNA